MAHSPSQQSLDLIDEGIRNIMIPALLRGVGIERNEVGKTENAAGTEAKPRTKTTYVVLESVELFNAEGTPSQAWQSIGSAEGINDVEAIKNATANVSAEAGVFIAIPARSFRSRSVKAETTRRLTIS